MKPLNLNQAARTCHKSKSAILEAIRSGRLSANRNDKNEWQIDPSELFRVYPYEIQNNETEQKNRNQPDTEPKQNSILFKELFEKEKEERERERAQMQETINDLRKRLDEESEERRKLTKLITYQPEPTKKKENFLFKKIFKK